ncbi:MAG: NADH-quinone oxidoreductase subunit L [Planctomycetes bacterium]|nr:NADH-quinone oxidoreductase subunit L [Planctomycetota bacterium]
MLHLFENKELLLWLVPLAPLFGFLINGFFGRRMNPTSSGGVASASVIVAFLAALSLFIYHMNGQEHDVVATSLFTWMDVAGLKVNMGLHLDRLSALYMLVITGVASLIHIYSVGYMSHDEGYWRYFAYLNLFVFSMLMLVLGDSLLTLFLGWEGVGLCSYLLIGFWYKHDANCNAGKKAFIVNRVGDFGFMAGMFLLFYQFGSLSYGGDGSLEQQVAQATAAGALNLPLLNLACVCLFIGACGKSAQIPLYVWLPDAMAGPTPVSALIHAATMVTAGIYMLARLNFVFVHAETAMAIVAVTGAITALFAGTIGLVQRDIKKVLAYSTVSQLGFMFMAAGLGAFPVAVFHVFTHAFFKALLFLGSGSVIHSLEHTLGHGNPDSQDLWKMGGLKKKMPITFVTMTVGSIALAGIPLFAGFFSKDAILYTAFHRGDALGMFVYFCGLLAAICTAFYSFRLIGLTFFGKWRGEEKVYAHADESPRSMALPLIILAFFAVFAGYLWLPVAVEHLLHVESHSFQTWLAPIWAQGQAALVDGNHLKMATEHDAAALTAEWMTMGISSVVAVLVSVFAFLFYSKPENIEKVKTLALGSDGKPRFTYTLLLNKYYVDEIYNAVIIKPLKALADAAFVLVDLVIIDLVLVNGSAQLVKAGSDLMRRVQTGVVRHYLYAFAVGAVVMTTLFLLIARQ